MSVVSLGRLEFGSAEFLPLFPTSDLSPLISQGVGPPTSGVADFRGVTGGVYKARERIHRRMLTGDY